MAFDIIIANNSKSWTCIAIALAQLSDRCHAVQLSPVQRHPDLIRSKNLIFRFLLRDSDLFLSFSLGCKCGKENLQW